MANTKKKAPKKKVVLSPIVLYFNKFIQGFDPVSGADISYTLKEPWPMLINKATGECWYAVNAKSKGQILSNTKAELAMWDKGAFYGTIS